MQNELGLHATAPYNGESWDLTQDVMVREGNKAKIKRDIEPPKPRQAHKAPVATPGRAKRESASYERLREAGEQIAGLINRMARSSGKNQGKLASALFSLVKRYQKR